jgi:cell division protein FtsI (penicillin-binding protein 3)
VSPEAQRSQRLRASAVVVGVGAAFVAVAGQLAMLAGSGGSEIVLTLNEPIAKSFARPDIVDRGGRLLATDVEMPSLFADPSLVKSADEIVEQVSTVLPGLDEADLRRQLEDRSKRFVWIRRGLSPRTAQAVHDLGLPGLAFRDELRRAYPLERLAGHTLGQVNVDNRGVAGIERYIDEAVGVEAVHGATLSAGVPVRLSLDLGAQHSLEDELRLAMSRYQAKAAAGLVMDIETGELLASASLPGLDPSFPLEARDPDRVDRIQGGTYELGSIFKTFTIAMALENGKTVDTMVDVTQPLTAGRFTITDTHPSGKPLSVADVFIHSSNVGAGMLALMAGQERQHEFFDKLGLLETQRTEAGPVAPPQVPQRVGRAEQITLSYGHGIAVAPLQVAVAAASLLNGGERVTPTFLRRADGAASGRPRVVGAATSKIMCELFRRNVTDAHGTGKRADVPGYRVGGKTGTAELPGRGGYSEKAVISSFLAAFPMDAPKYLVLVSLFEPKGTAETKGEILAGLNAAPTAGRVIARIAPMLGVVPDGALAAAQVD